MKQRMIEKRLPEEVLFHDMDNSALDIRWRGNGQLLLNENGTDIPVQAFQCFPWSEPGTFISLRDADEKEIALIQSLDELNASSRKAIENALVAVGFVMEIQAIEGNEENFEIRNWWVKTAQGQRKFQTLLDDKLREIPGGGLLIEDISGDLFYIADHEALDQKSKKLLWAFLD